jgi:hypothetical protein
MMQLPTERSKIVTDVDHCNYLIYGEPGVGKTTFCSEFEGALFIATEPGHKFQEIFKLDCKNWQDIRDAAALVCTTEHDYKNIVFDTLDNAYKFCTQYIIDKENVLRGLEGDNKITKIKDVGEYGGGYAMVAAEIMKIVTALSQRGYGLVFISHAQIREVEEQNVKRPITDTTLSPSFAKVIRGYCDFIFYCHSDASGHRIMRTKGTPNVVAKDRSRVEQSDHGGVLPELMALDFKSFKKTLTDALITNN